MNQRSNIIFRAYEEMGIKPEALLERTCTVVAGMKEQGKLPPMTDPKKGADYSTLINLFVKNAGQKGRAKIIGSSDKITIGDFFDKSIYGGMHGMFAQPHLYNSSKGRNTGYPDKDITALTLTDIKDFSPQAMMEIFILSAMTQLLRQKEKAAPAPEAVVVSEPPATPQPFAVPLIVPLADKTVKLDVSNETPPAISQPANDWLEAAKLLERIATQMPKRRFRTDLKQLLTRYEKD